MQKQKIYIYLFEGYSDWEIAYLTPELMKSGEYESLFVADCGAPLHSMGGLKVTPDIALKEVEIAQSVLLILPGGNGWQQAQNRAVDGLIQQMLSAGKMVAAICGATAYLHQFGCFATYQHSSNALGYLQWAIPEYQEAHNYKDVPALQDKNLITASGLAPIEFAYVVMKALQLKPEDELEQWYGLFKEGVY